MSTSKVNFVDLDGTLCTEAEAFERALATPLAGAREALKRFYGAGHTIVIWTARNARLAAMASPPWLELLFSEPGLAGQLRSQLGAFKRAAVELLRLLARKRAKKRAA